MHSGEALRRWGEVRQEMEQRQKHRRGASRSMELINSNQQGNKSFFRSSTDSPVVGARRKRSVMFKQGCELAKVEGVEMVHCGEIKVTDHGG